MTTVTEVGKGELVLLEVRTAEAEVTPQEAEDGLAALNDMMNEWSVDGIDIGYEALDNIEDALHVTLGSIGALTANLSVHIAPGYPIGAMRVERPRFDEVSMAGLGGDTYRRDRRSERAKHPWLYGDDYDDEAEANPGRSRLVREIIDLIRNHVAPQSWRERGGSIGTIDEINGAIREAAEGSLKGILSYCEDPIVSSDIIGDPHSSIFDSLSTMVMPSPSGKMIKVVSWYDNEWGYSTRTAEIIAKLAAL